MTDEPTDAASFEEVVDAADYLVDALEEHDEVAYGEVGGVVRDGADVVVTGTGVRSAAEVETSGVWFRAFSEGVADYRFSASLERDHLDEQIDRAVRADRVLDQADPSRYDAGTAHRATHPGWGRGDLTARTAEEKAAAVSDAFGAAVGGLDLDRGRVTYADERRRGVLLTTTGTALSTTLDRAQAETVLAPGDAPKLMAHAGSTAGQPFLDGLGGEFESLAAAVRRARGVPTAVPDAGRADVAFAPTAAAALFHQLSHYLEIDMVYFGASPWAPGDEVAPSSLTMSDAVRPGSWGAMAYDAEGRPTHPTALVDDGVVVNRLYDTVSAIEEGAHAAGNVVPASSHEHPPRVHARHLDVDAGSATWEALREDADVAVERVGEPTYVNEATRTKRESVMPASPLYAKDIREATPSDYDDEAAEQAVRFPLVEAYTLDGGERDARIEGGAVEFALGDLRSLAGLTARRETVTGNCSKHKSAVPYAVTAPGALLSTTLAV